MPKSNSVIETCRREVASMKRSVFLLLSLWEKRGLRTCWHLTKHWKGADGGGGGDGGGLHFLSFFSPSSNSTLPRCPQLRPFREMGGGWGVCACVCLLGGGGSCWSRTEWNLLHCLPSCTPSLPCLTPCLPPPSSRDKECPECLASPAVSNN